MTKPAKCPACGHRTVGREEDLRQVYKVFVKDGVLEERAPSTVVVDSEYYCYHCGKHLLHEEILEANRANSGKVP